VKGNAIVEQSESLLRAHLRTHQLKNTRQRIRVLHAFLECSGHPTVDDVVSEVRKRDRSVGTSTVYRTMRVLVEAGVATEHRFGGESTRYEAAVRKDHHDHFICEVCGTIIEFEEPRIEALQDEAAARHGFVPRSHRLEIFGVCRRCS